MIKYLCIDDEAPESIAAIIAPIKAMGTDLDIIHMNPLEDFANQVQDIQENINKRKYHGLILDLRLDMNKSSEGAKAGYRAFSLAQEIRTRITEKKFLDCPIVLCSLQNRLLKSYSTDDTSHDLYDAVYEKDTVPENASVIAKELKSLVKGYKFIGMQIGGERSAILKMICQDIDADKILNPAILTIFDKKRPIHEYARFILNDLIRISGPLIDEATLAARVGIDMEQSADWGKLKVLLSSKAGYRGAFSDGWQRWWATSVEEWWKNLKNNPGPLSRIPADERVNFIKKAANLKKLVVAQPIETSYSNRYWTICRGFNRPLDPVDGFIMREDGERKPWQDKAYISIKAALERKDGLKVHRSEQERFKEIKAAKK